MSEKQLPAAPDWFDPKKILAQYVAGEGTDDIAKKLGVAVKTLRYHLASHSPEDWKAAVLLTALQRQQEAEDEIDDAKDMLALRKAETKLKSAQWNLERVCRRIYGDAKEAPQQQMVMVNVNLRRDGNDVEYRSVSADTPVMAAVKANGAIALAERGGFTVEGKARSLPAPEPVPASTEEVQAEAPAKPKPVQKWGEPLSPSISHADNGIKYDDRGIT